MKTRNYDSVTTDSWPANPIIGISGSFSSAFLDENVCRQWVINRLHPVPACPVCKSILLVNRLDRFRSGKRLKCADCGKFFSALSGTIFAGRPFSYADIVLFQFLIEQKFTAKQISEFLHINPDTARSWKRWYDANQD